MALVLLVAATACGSKDGSEPTVSADSGTTTVPPESTSASLQATLTGASEAPAPGDPDGSGRAVVTLDLVTGEVCFEITVAGIDTPVGMHIHEGAAGGSGPIAIPFATPTAGDGTTTGCVAANRQLLRRIAADPGAFYLNVHTEPFPGGAVRDQLVKATAASPAAPAPATGANAAPPAPATTVAPAATPRTTARTTVTTPGAQSATTRPAVTTAPQSAASTAPPTTVPPTTASPATAPPATSPPTTSEPATPPPTAACDYPPCY